MSTLFKKPSNKLIEHGHALYVYLEGKTRFDYKNEAHTALVKSCTEDLKAKLTALQEVDKKMAVGFTVGITSLAVSWLFPVLGIVATAGFAYGAYQLGKRQQAYIEYETALENLAQCCAWTLDNISIVEALTHANVRNAEVNEMIKTIAPLTSARQLHSLVDPREVASVEAQADKVRKNISVFDQHLDKEKAELYFNIYGYKQGGFLAIIKGIGYAIQNAFSSIKTSLISERGVENTNATSKQ